MRCLPPFVAVLLLAACEPTTTTTTDAVPRACLIPFRRAFLDGGGQADPTDAYGAYGVQFASDEGYGAVGGEIHGDPGRWSQLGRVPDEAWGLWDFGGSVATVSWGVFVEEVSFRLSRSGRSGRRHGELRDRPRDRCAVTWLMGARVRRRGRAGRMLAAADARARRRAGDGARAGHRGPTAAGT